MFSLDTCSGRVCLANGQLQLSKMPAGKNPAAMLTKHLSASNLHKLLPKLGVTTRAADSRALLSVLNLEVLASTREEQSSFFIGMMAEQPASAQLVASSVASRACQDSSLQEHNKEAIQSFWGLLKRVFINGVIAKLLDFWLSSKLFG